MTGPANVRDLGGLPLSGGGTTRRGVLLRGDAWYAGDVAPEAVSWPPARVVDLRSPREWDAHGQAWPPGTVVVRHELYDAGDLNRIPATTGLLGVYRGILDTASERVAAVVNLLDTSGSTLVHCAAGKDRTGVVVAALLLAAGVEADAVVADYRRTEEAMPSVLDRLHAVGALDRAKFLAEWALAPAEAIGLVVERLVGWPSGPRRWILDHGGDELALDGFIRRFTD